MDRFKYINNINVNDIFYSSYFSDKINSYDIFEKIFDDTIKTMYYLKSGNKINSENMYMIDFYYNNTQLAETYENMLYFTTNSLDNNVNLIYIKNSNQMFFIVKSYEMLDKNNIIPFFKYFVHRDDNIKFFKKMDKSFTDEETLLIINYVN